MFWNYVLTDSETGYIYNILLYYSNITFDKFIKPELPVGTRIALHLSDKLLPNIPGAQSYHMYTDRYWTNIPLAEELMKMKCLLTGTLQIKRMQIPDY